MADPVAVSVTVPNLPVAVSVAVPDLPVLTDVSVLGIQGPVGTGVPAGGATSTLLAKSGTANYDTEWVSSLSGIDAIFFDTAAGLEADTEGELVWDDEAGTIDIGINSGLKLHVGQEMFIRVTNQTGQTLPKGTLLAYDGTVGNSGRLLVKKAVADGTEAPNLILGIAPAAIDNGADGYALQQGRIKPFNTTATNWQAEDILWADPAVPGGLTRVEPAAPNLRFAAAVVVAVGASGTLYVRLTAGSSLEHDDLVTLTNLQQGDTLLWDAAQGRFENGQPPTAAVDSVNGQVGTVVLGAADVGAYSSTNPSAFVDAAGAAAAAPVQSVNGAVGTVVLDAASVGAYSSTNPSNFITSAGAPVQSVNGAAGTVVLDYEDVQAIGTAVGLYVYDYGTAIPSTRPVSLAVYWRGTAEPGTAIAQAGDLWYDADGA